MGAVCGKSEDSLAALESREGGAEVAADNTDSLKVEKVDEADKAEKEAEKKAEPTQPEEEPTKPDEIVAGQNAADSADQVTKDATAEVEVKTGTQIQNEPTAAEEVAKEAPQAAPNKDEGEAKVSEPEGTAVDAGGEETKAAEAKAAEQKKIQDTEAKAKEAKAAKQAAEDAKKKKAVETKKRKDADDAKKKAEEDAKKKAAEEAKNKAEEEEKEKRAKLQKAKARKIAFKSIDKKVQTEMVAKLCKAAGAGDIAVLNELLEANVDLDVFGPVGEYMTALHCATQAGQVEFAKELLANGADPYGTIKGGANTPLHLAAKENNAALCEVIGANLPKALTMKNSQGHTPKDLAEEAGSEAALKALKKLAKKK